MRTPKGHTQALINRLRDMGWSKWGLAFKVFNPPLTWRTIDAWSNGEWEATGKHLLVLQDLYFEECRKHQEDAFRPKNKALDTRKKFFKKHKKCM